MPLSSRPGPLAAIGGAAARHPWITLAVWLLLITGAVATAVGGIAGESVFDRLKSDSSAADGESSHADDVLAGDEQERSSHTLLADRIAPDDPNAVETVADLVARLVDLPHTSVVTPVGVPTLPDGSVIPELAPLVANGGDGFLLTLTVEGVDGGLPDDAVVDAATADLQEAADELRQSHPEAIVEVGGGGLLNASIVEISENDLKRGEAVALPIALVVMLVVFGGFIAAGIPLAGAGVSIVGALGALLGFTYLLDIDTTVVNVVTAVGLGLSIDYGLLIVSRFREEHRAAGIPGREGRLAAIGRTAQTAGRTVVYSGVTFAIASLGLLVFEPRIVRAIGLGGLAVTVIAITSALTLIPALLSLTGDRLLRPGALTRLPGIGKAVSRFGDIAPDDGFFSKLTRRVQRHPAITTMASGLLLVLLGSPLASLQLANTSVDALPASSTQYTFLEALTDHFPDATSPRVALVTETEAAAETWSDAVADVDGVESTGTPAQTGDAWLTVVRVDPADGIDVVNAIRADRAALQDDGLGDAWVTGSDARTVDFSNSLLGSAPWAALIIALGTVIFLFLMTGSLVIPIKALLASALSLGASIGVLVWGFEQGNFAPLMGFDPADVHGVDVLVLLLTFAFGFGLAMDYEMFILSRIKEQVDAGVPDREAIARGLQRSGRIITSAALIIIVVFAGFATGDLMVIKQLVTALAVAVLLDATLVRCLLVPALMTWQQRIMWWAPKWMKRLHARFGLSE
ncbi:MAG: MMPL family transporter [Pseudolysinimonas sp.]